MAKNIESPFMQMDTTRERLKTLKERVVSEGLDNLKNKVIATENIAHLSVDVAPVSKEEKEAFRYFQVATLQLVGKLQLQGIPSENIDSPNELLAYLTNTSNIDQSSLTTLETNTINLLTKVLQKGNTSPLFEKIFTDWQFIVEQTKAAGNTLVTDNNVAKNVAVGAAGGVAGFSVLGYLKKKFFDKTVPGRVFNFLSGKKSSKSIFSLGKVMKYIGFTGLAYVIYQGAKGVIVKSPVSSDKIEENVNASKDKKVETNNKEKPKNTEVEKSSYTPKRGLDIPKDVTIEKKLEATDKVYDEAMKRLLGENYEMNLTKNLAIDPKTLHTYVLSKIRLETGGKFEPRITNQAGALGLGQIKYEYLESDYRANTEIDKFNLGIKPMWDHKHKKIDQSTYITHSKYDGTYGKMKGGTGYYMNISPTDQMQMIIYNSIAAIKKYSGDKYKPHHKEYNPYVMSGMAWLSGPTNFENFLAGDRKFRDANGTSAIKYGNMLSGFMKEYDSTKTFKV